MANSPSGGAARTMRVEILPETPGMPKLQIRRQEAEKKRVSAPAAGDYSDEQWKVRCEALFEGMYDAALITDSAGCVEHSNRRATDFLLFSREELKGKNIIGLISGADQALLGTVSSTMKNQRFALIQAHCVRRDGSVFPSEISVSFADECEKGLCFFIRDVTVRREHENKLLEQRNAIQNADNGIAMSDLNGVVTYANPAAFRILGYEKDSDLVGENVASLWAGENPADTGVIMDSVTSGRGSWNGDLAATKPDGAVINVNVSICGNLDSDGVLSGLVFSFVDITDRVAAVKRLRELAETKSRFVAEASHELRTPLAIINEFVSLLNDGVPGPVSDRQKECLQTVLRNCKRLSTLVDTMLDLAKIEAGQVAVARKRNAVVPLLTESRENFLPVCAAAKQELLLDIADGCPDVYCDADSVQKIMMNLVGNAVKFTPEGGRIDIRCRREGKFARVEVKDSGRGIPADAQEAVFEPFRQVQREDGPGAKGTGLGLAIVKSLVELNGGMIALESEAGKGSCFSFTLPLYARDARIPPRVLIVDDDPVIVEVIERALESLEVNMEVKSTRSGLESLLMTGEHDPHIVILDVRLGDVDGAEILGLLRQKFGKSEEKVKVLAISGDENMLRDMMERGADDYLRKPFAADALVAKVKALIGKMFDATG